MKNYTLLCWFALALGCDGGSGRVEQISPQSPVQLTQDDLQGTWKAIAARVDGGSFPDMMGVEYTFEPSGELIIQRPEGGEPRRDRFEVDPKPNPPHLDLIMDIMGKESSHKGIFRIKDGKLYFCRAAGEKYERPSSFAADKIGYGYYIFERIQ